MISVTWTTALTAASTLGVVVLIGFTAVHVRRRGWNGTLLAFSGLLLGALCWSGGELLRELTVTPERAGWLAGFVQFGVGLIPASFLLLALAYTGRTGWLDRRVVGLLTVEPVLTIALAVTNPRGAMYAADGGLGPYHVFHALYSYVLLIAGMGIFVRTLVDERSLYRHQTMAIVLGVSVPFAVNVVSTFDLVPTYGVPTPAIFVVWVGAIGYAVLRFRLLDVVPVARDRVIENMRDGFVVVNDRGRVVDANPAARRLLGVDDPVGAPAVDVLGPCRELASRWDGRVDDTERPATEVEFTTVVDGDERHVRAEASLLPDGRTGAQLVTLRDVTGRRRVEQRYQRLIERSSDVIVVFDDHGTVEYVSRSIERVLGYDPERMKPTGFDDVVHEDDLPRVREAVFDDMDEPGATVRFECRVRTADGEWRVLEGVGRNLTDDPFVAGRVVNARDITERKEHERDLERTNRRLEEFASVVAHDLRNPLNVAMGQIDLATRETDSEYLDRAMAATERMQRLLDDLLELARQGQTVEETEAVELGAVVDAAWATVETGDLALELDAETPVFEADPARLQQLLENLFRNVVDHADEATTVRIGTTSDGFYVADDGSGIPTEERERVFEHGHSTAREGTGFGLSIVENIAHAHGWEVSAVESEAGGARFDVSGVERSDVVAT